MRLRWEMFALLTLLLLGCGLNPGRNIVLENRFFRYEISGSGTNLGFSDKAAGIDYLDGALATKCAFAEADGQTFEITSLSRRKDVLTMEFGSSGVSTTIEIREEKDRIILIVRSVTGDPDAINFLNVPLRLEAQAFEPFAACVLSMNIFTHVRLLPPLQNKLWAKCYKKFGIEGAEITILGLPQEKMLPVIRDVVSGAPGIPFSDEGGAWALMKEVGYGSYIMNFGTLTEENTDEWIDKCKKLGFSQIDSHGGGGFFEFGTLELNREKWPDGWESFRRINKRLHEAGISHIFHTYAFFIDKNSRYVTPVPSKDLGFAAVFTLDGPVSENAGEIVVRESTAGISTITGFHTENSITLRIGEELIEFSGVTKTPPYKFTGLKRGALGTRPSALKSGEKAYHLSERFNRFVPGPETALFDEVAKKHADIVNYCEFDGIYFDAIDGSSVLGGEENFWYYGTKFIFEVARHLQRPVGMEMSSMAHHWWHFRSRWQAWDRPVRGYKRFIDIHLASVKASALFLPDAIKSNEWEHGRWPGHAPLIDKYAALDKGQILLPLHLGWWGHQTWNPPQVEPTFPDDIEYLCCKMIGNNAGFSQLGGIDDATLRDIPLFGRNSEIIRQYEQLRTSGYFSDTIRGLLRQPGREFTLTDQQGRWNFKPVTFNKHKISGSADSWIVENEFDRQPVQLRIEALMSVEPYDDPSGIVLDDYTNPGTFLQSLKADGVSGRLTPEVDSVISDEAAARFSAKNGGNTPADGAYINLEKTFDPPVNLSDNQALGVWVRGDGNGQILNLSIRSPLHISHGAHGDHFIKVDFTGWKYFELVEIESSEISRYRWPDDSHFYVYDAYRHTVDFRTVEKFQLWYNNLPAGKEVNTIIGPVKALRIVSREIENPSVTIGNQTIVFPVKMESGTYLELRSANDCILYGKKGEVIKKFIPLGPVPELFPGENAVSFSCEGTKKVNSRVQVTVISEGPEI